MERTIMYEVTIKGHRSTFTYNSEQTQITIGPFKMNRKQAMQYCRHLQKCMGEQVKIEFKRVTFKIKKNDLQI